MKVLESTETITGEDAGNVDAFDAFVIACGGSVERRKSGLVIVTLVSGTLYLMAGEWLISYGNDDFEVLSDAKARRRFHVKASV